MQTKTRIAAGTFGYVDKIECSDGSCFAQKCAHPGCEMDLQHEGSICKILLANPSPNIVRIFEVANDHINMEFGTNQTLWQLIYKNQAMYDSLSPEQVEGIMLCCTRGAADFQRITNKAHFDIKPGNIIMDKHWCPKLCDFGIASNPIGYNCKSGMIRNFSFPFELSRS